MTITLFALIAWLTISAFFLIPKGLTAEANIIMFFIIDIAVISVFTILTLNIKFIQLSNTAEDFIATCIYRDVIIPVILLIILNTMFFYNSKYKRLFAIIISISALIFIELLNLWTGTKFYKGWNYLFTIAILIVLILLFYIVAKVVRKIT